MPDDVLLFAEEQRENLPPGFDAVAQEFVVLLETGKPIDTVDRGGSLDGLYSCSRRRRRLAPIVQRYLRQFERSGSKALQARARAIRARLATEP